MNRRIVIKLSAARRRALQDPVTRAAETDGVVRRANVVLWSTEGVSGTAIAQRLHLSPQAVSVIRRRFVDGTAAVRAWLAAHPQVHFHYTPTSASWLNQVEGFFGILGKQSLSRTDLHSTRALRDHLRAYLRAWNRCPTPVAWTEPAQAIIRSHRRMLERISTAVQ